MIVLRVVHPDLTGGEATFTDDEVVEMLVIPQQIVTEQESQSGSLTFVYIGDERYEFDIQFSVFYQSTLHKLSAIRRLREIVPTVPVFDRGAADRVHGVLAAGARDAGALGAGPACGALGSARQVEGIARRAVPSRGSKLTQRSKEPWKSSSKCCVQWRW